MFVGLKEKRKFVFKKGWLFKKNVSFEEEREEIIKKKKIVKRS